MNGALRVRLRTQNGDLGPVDAAGTETVGELKSRLLSTWSRLTADAKVESESPASIACIKLILNGKFLDNDEVLADLQRTLTDPAEHSIVTMHAIVRPQAALKTPAKSKDKDAGKGCSCVIC
jgi:hypothetical protein